MHKETHHAEAARLKQSIAAGGGNIPLFERRYKPESIKKIVMAARRLLKRRR